GRIADVREELGESPEDQHFRATFAEHRAMKPPRVVTQDVHERLRSEPGYNVQHSVRLLSKALFEDLANPPRAWIFQANPDTYDVRTAVRELRQETWTVTAHRDEIVPGDRVYLWEAGPKGGIVAAAEVLDRPSIRPLPEAGRRFVKDPRINEE